MMPRDLKPGTLLLSNYPVPAVETPTLQPWEARIYKQ
jgi:hypothetical protein